MERQILSTLRTVTFIGWCLLGVTAAGWLYVVANVELSRYRMRAISAEIGKSAQELGRSISESVREKPRRDP